MIKILTDSTADLPIELIEQYDIHVIPLAVNIDGRAYLDDGVDIGRREFYRKLRTAKKLPTTSQPSVGDFRKHFSELRADGSEVLCLTISSDLSGTYLAASSAAEEMSDPGIHVMDSRLVSVALGRAALYAAGQAAAGQGVDEIMAGIRTMGQDNGIVFLVDTLDYLHKGGRIGTAAAVLGTLLSVKPILTIKEGMVQALQKVRTRKQAKEMMLSLLEEQVPPGTTACGAIAHGDNISEATWLANELRARYDCRDLYIAEMGPVVGTHGGPGIFGAAIFPERTAGEPVRG